MIVFFMYGRNLLELVKDHNKAAILHCIWFYSRQTGFVIISIPEISKQTLIPERTCKRYISELKVNGFIIGTRVNNTVKYSLSDEISRYFLGGQTGTSEINLQDMEGQNGTDDKAKLALSKGQNGTFLYNTNIINNNINNTVKEKKINKKSNKDLVLSTSLQEPTEPNLVLEKKELHEFTGKDLVNKVRNLLFEIFGEYHKRNGRNFSPSEKDLGNLTNLSKKFSIEYRNNPEIERYIRQDCFTFYNFICQRPGGSGNYKYENISFTPSMMIAWLDKARTIRENEELQTFKEIDKEIHRIFKSSLNPWASISQDQVKRAYYLGYEPPKKKEPSLEGTVKTAIDKLDEIKLFDK